MQKKRAHSNAPFDMQHGGRWLPFSLASVYAGLELHVVLCRKRLLNYSAAA
jgi:hypothetical protein